jgi:hypothetical protein
VGLSFLTSAHELPHPFGSEAKRALTQGNDRFDGSSDPHPVPLGNLLVRPSLSPVQSFGTHLARAAQVAPSGSGLRNGGRGP